MTWKSLKRLSILLVAFLPVVLFSDIRDTPATPKANERIGALVIWLTDKEIGRPSEHRDFAVFSPKLEPKPQPKPKPVVSRSRYFKSKGLTTLAQEQFRHTPQDVAQCIEAKLWPAFGQYIDTGWGAGYSERFFASSTLSSSLVDIVQVIDAFSSKHLPSFAPVSISFVFQPASWQFLFFQPIIIGTLIYVFWEKIKIRQISRLDGNNHTDRY